MLVFSCAIVLVESILLWLVCAHSLPCDSCNARWQSVKIAGIAGHSPRHSPGHSGTEAHLKPRRVLIPLAAIAAVACAAVFLVRPWPGEALSCGLGLPPGSPGFAEAQAKELAEAKMHGYLRVCDANLDRFRIAFLPSAAIMGSLAFQPVELRGTAFAQFESLGAMAEPDDASGARLYRGFRMANGRTVTLFEHDMSVKGTSSWRDPKDEPERINGMPARFSVLQAPSGNAISHLSWVERRRSYELWIDANAAGTPLRDQLFALATAIPLSVPACPNEVLPKPVRMQANGLPAEEPIAAGLTEAEFNAKFAETKRPCK